MKHSLTKKQQPTKLGGRGTLPWEMAEKVAYGLLCPATGDLEESLGWNNGGVLTEVRITRQKDGWRGMVKAERGRLKRVAYVNALTYLECVDMVTYLAASAELTFYPDKWPVKYE